MILLFNSKIHHKVHYRLDGGFRPPHRCKNDKRRFASNHDGMQGQLLLSFLGLVHHLGKRQVSDSFAVEDEG